MDIVIDAGPDTGKHLPLGSLPLIIGRDPACDLVLTDQSVSSRHLQVRAMPTGGIEVTDLHSTNGTWLAGRMINGATQVGQGERVVVGTTAFHVEAAHPPATQIVAPPPGYAPPPGAFASPGAQIHAGPIAGGNIHMSGERVVGRDYIVHDEGIRIRTRMTARARRTLFFGLALFFVGLAVGFGAIAAFNNELFNQQPSFEGPSSEIKTAFAVAFAGAGLNLVGIVFIVVALLMRRERVQEITASRRG